MPLHPEPCTWPQQACTCVDGSGPIAPSPSRPDWIYHGYEDYAAACRSEGRFPTNHAGWVAAGRPVK
jgi:hypothetical protein